MTARRRYPEALGPWQTSGPIATAGPLMHHLHEEALHIQHCLDTWRAATFTPYVPARAPKHRALPGEGEPETLNTRTEYTRE